ncbi:hypothetical protein R1sor_020668 [Riccia sorocarpa]|uniref:Uncharacterized protein n=1 Tax=Riccia sorocarpa TaxID=122646 RepID=A0ABD3GGL6_9MARC
MASCVTFGSSMLAAPAAVNLSSSRSVTFNNGGLRVNSFAAQKMRPGSLCIRAERDPRKPDDENLVDKVKNAVADIQMKAQEIMPGSNADNQPTVGSPGRKPGKGRQGQPEHKSSTGGITQAAYDAAEKTAVVFDGVRENVMEKLQDDGRDLKSKTGDVAYGAHRNANHVPSDAKERNIKEQSEYTKNL